MVQGRDSLSADFTRLRSVWDILWGMRSPVSCLSSPSKRGLPEQGHGYACLENRPSVVVSLGAGKPHM